MSQALFDLYKLAGRKVRYPDDDRVKDMPPLVKKEYVEERREEKKRCREAAENKVLEELVELRNKHADLECDYVNALARESRLKEEIQQLKEEQTKEYNELHWETGMSLPTKKDSWILEDYYFWFTQPNFWFLRPNATFLEPSILLTQPKFCLLQPKKVVFQNSTIFFSWESHAGFSVWFANKLVWRKSIGWLSRN